ncbi:TPA: hypothetical protein ACSCXL_000319 [Aeromonas veronii]
MLSQDEMIQIAVVMEYHLDWPEYRTIDLPVLPDGWFWVGKGDGERFWMDIGCPWPDADASSVYERSDWVTKQMVSERASLLNSNRGLLEVM